MEVIMVKKRDGSEKRRYVSFQIALRERKEDDPTPELSAIAEDQNHKAIETVDVATNGVVRMSKSAFDRAAMILIGPRGAELGGDMQFVRFHKYQIADAIGSKRLIDLPRRSWLPFLTFQRCISGTAEHCQWRPWLIHFNNKRFLGLSDGGTVKLAGESFATESLLEPFLPIWLSCTPLCDGLVEVYRRTCCCPPLVILDPRIPDIIVNLEEIVRVKPPFPFPPGPEPDPIPFENIQFFAGGAENQSVINADVDLKALKSLPNHEQAAYIQGRPYLFCSCSSAVHVASGFLSPDGSFDICWNEPLRLFWRHCHDEFAFVIKQAIDGSTVTIYDGVAASQWFHIDDNIELTSYHPDAIVCDYPTIPPPGTTGTSVMLEKIRSTVSLHLNSPLPTQWDRVATASGNDGLAHPAPPPAPADAATVQYKNVGWGKILPLRYLFFQDLEPIATYFRISVVKADASGAPTGTPVKLQESLSWGWYRRKTDLTIKRESFPLGPEPGTDKLYLIPYRSLLNTPLLPGEIGEWAAGQFHGLLDTTSFQNTRYLVTLELFDSAKNQIKPLTAPHVPADLEIPAPFSFQTWDQSDLSTTVPVPYKALTHLFWWDNRSTQAKILDVLKGGFAVPGKCLFLEGPRTTTVSIKYRAKHPESRFLYRHDLRWKRGLYPDWTVWVPWNATNEDPGTSPTREYAELLELHDKCSFTIEVRTRAKITDGSGRIQDYHDRDIGSLAIISPE
jgi:hypothetical protein